MASRRGLLRTLAGAAFAGGGCVARRTGETPVYAQIGTVSGAFDVFETCLLDVTGVSVEPHDGTFETYDIPRETLDLANGDGPWTIAEVGLPAGAYERIRFEVDGVRARLTNGEPVPITASGRDVITVGAPFRVREHVGTTLTALLSLIEAETTGRYGVRAVPHLLRVNYADGPRTHTFSDAGWQSVSR
jgi:hypothetical protein